MRQPDGGLLLDVPRADSGCGGADAEANAGAPSTDAGGAPHCVPSAIRDYQTEVRPVLGACHGEVCHGGTFLVSSQLTTLLNATAKECCGHRQLIVPGHPEQSYVLAKVQGKNVCDGARMPLGGPYLADSDIQVLSDWICEGAPF